MFHDMFVHSSGLRRVQGTQRWVINPERPRKLSGSDGWSCPIFAFKTFLKGNLLGIFAFKKLALRNIVSLRIICVGLPNLVPKGWRGEMAVGILDGHTFQPVLQRR